MSDLINTKFYFSHSEVKWISSIRADHFDYLDKDSDILNYLSSPNVKYGKVYFIEGIVKNYNLENLKKGDEIYLSFEKDGVTKIGIVKAIDYNARVILFNYKQDLYLN